MIRVLIESLLLFLAPAAIYYLFAFSTRRPGVTTGEIISGAPTLLLSIIGAALVFTVMVAFGSIGDGRPGQAYEPAVVGNDGRIVPGRMK